MRKSILVALMAVCVSSMSFATEGDMTFDSKSSAKTNAKAKVSPICLAVAKGNLEAVKIMIEFGSDVNEISGGITPLMYAARYNRTDIIKILVAQGADIKIKNYQGFDAMKFAELSNAKEAMSLLKKIS